MEKVVYLIMSRDKDKFDIVYVGDCEKTDDLAFFTGNSSFKCWVQKSLSEKSLYLAILPLFDASAEGRQSVLNKIKTHYNPPCNPIGEPEKPDYKVRVSEPTFPCACCGAEMKAEKILEKSTLFRCTSCGISDTKLT